MDFVAISIKEFINSDYVHNQITTHLTDTETLKLGFTSSFSVSHTAIDSGILLRWARGSQCSGAVGNDIVQLLQSALGRNGVNICCAALVNVAVGSLLTQAYNYPSKFTAAILTSGATGAYIEDTRNIRTPQSDASEMLISIDWGNFDKDKHILPVTIFDNKLDRESTNPGFQVFEKMVSGMYLGEITRNILLHLIDHRALFDGTSSPILNRSWSFLTKHMSDIERDRTPMLIPTAQLLEHELEIKFNTLADRQVLKYVCQLVGKRAARLSAMVAAALIRQMLEKGCLRDRGYTLRTSQESYSYLSRSNHGSSNNHGRAGVQSNSAPASLSSTSSATSTTSSSGGQPSSHATPIHVGVESSVYELYPDFKTNMKEALVEILGPSANETVVLDTASRDGFGIGAALATMETSMTLSGEARNRSDNNITICRQQQTARKQLTASSSQQQ
ncbi:glucokinase [Lunasporangiospora selenospora]|uniref:Phosphotransferase n=1 Tax=Lunasporangiospora selenospora TaxID=979761 RepID=A0A9P6KJE0_9FUNG|nr:glucokinase [Lunasporangiospora selenospora]